MKRSLALLLLLAVPAFAQIEKPAPPADLNSPPASAEKLPSGLVTLKLADGTGTKNPSGTDILNMRYTVWRSDGSVVAHVKAPRTSMLGLPTLLPGWAEAAKLMVEGESRRTWIPSSLGGGKIKEGETFVIDTELIEIVPPPVAPPDVAAAPEDAVKTQSGLAYKVLRPGRDEEKPSRSSSVLVHYSGWTTDGKMFDSTILRGEPAFFPLSGVIRGWTEGLQLMTPGQKNRFWIPSHLAYGRERGKPQGMLVFDIELLSVTR
jgi:peptidylprolyl isomerase